VLTATAGLAAGLAFGWVEALVAGAAAAALLVMALPFLLGARAYEVRVVLERERVVAGAAARATVVVRNIGRTTAPGRIDIPIGPGLVEVGVPLLAADEVSRHAVDLPPQRRGIVRIGPATTIRSDPLGLLRREHAFDDVQELFVHPRTVTVPSTSAGLIRDLDGSATRRLVDADMSFHAIREYAPGDARRQIHWKSTAKTGRLMVRQYEESRRSRMAVVLGLSSAEYASDDEFELAVSAASSLALRAVHDARDLDIVVGAEIPRVVRGRLRAIRHIAASARAPCSTASAASIASSRRCRSRGVPADRRGERAALGRCPRRRLGRASRGSAPGGAGLSGGCRGHRRPLRRARAPARRRSVRSPS
jgi:uncharacterized protein (DUF58 family)